MGHDRKLDNQGYPNFAVTGRITGAAQKVHRGLGPGFREIIYQRALALELAAQNLEHSREVRIPIYYSRAEIGRSRVDFIIDDVVVELKAKSVIDEVDFIQTLSYLKASGYAVGLLLNLRTRSLQVRRLLNTR